MSIIAHHVECFGLDVCGVHALPGEVIFREFGVGCLFVLFSDRVNG